MKLATYQKRRARDQWHCMILTMTDAELAVIQERIGPGPYSFFYDKGYVQIQQVTAGGCHIYRHTVNKGFHTLQQTRLMCESTPKVAFGATELPDAHLAWDDGLLLIDTSGLPLPPVAGRKPQQKRQTKRLPMKQLQQLNFEGTQMKTINGEAADAAAPVINGKLMRRVIATLEDVFDDQKGLYVTGWNDERVAKECNASFDFVVKTRREAFGEIKEDPRMAELRRDLEALIAAKRVSDDNFAQRFSQLEARVANLELAPKFK